MSIGKFSEFYVDVTKDATKIPQEQYLAAGRYPIIDQGQKSIAGMWDNPDGLYEKVPAIVFGDHTRTIKYVDTPFFIGADGVKVLRPVQAGDNVKYLFYVLQAARIPNLGYSRHFKVVKELKIRMYPRKKQDEIVRVLEQIDSLLEQRQNEILLMDQLVKSRFIEIVNEKQPIKTAEEVCSVIIDCPHSTPRYDEAALIYPSIRTSEIRNGEIDWSSMKYVGENEYYERTKRLTPQPGDIVYAREGTYGDCVILPVGYSFCLGQRTMLFRPDGVICNSIYLHQALRSDDVKRQANESNAGSTVPHVNVADAKKFSFPLPSIAVQSRFAAFVAEVDKSKLAVKQSLEKLETLKKSLMQQYFG